MTYTCTYNDLKWVKRASSTFILLYYKDLYETLDILLYDFELFNGYKLNNKDYNTKVFQVEL